MFLTATFLTELVCGLCGKPYSKSQLQTVCQDCVRPLLAAYDLSAVSAILRKEDLAAGKIGAAEGRFVAPESAACCAAAGKLANSGWIQPDEQIVICNTGTGIKYLECFADSVRSAQLHPACD
jgi:threonine synthase